MRPNFYLSSIALSVIFCASSAEAAVLIPLQQESFTQIQKDYQLILPNGVKYTSPAKNNLQFLSQHTDDSRMTHIRMQQYYAGYPVYRGYAIIHSSQDAKTLLKKPQDVKLTGTLYKDLNVDLGQPSAAFLSNSTLALQHFKRQFPQSKLSQEVVTPMVYIDKNNHAFWAYRVSVLVQYEDQIPQRPTAIIDAKTYTPFIQWNDIKTAATQVYGAGFGGNPVTGKKQYGLGLPSLVITRNPSTNQCYMENAQVRVLDLRNNYQEVSAPIQFPCKPGTKPDTFWTGYKSDGYDQKNGGYSSANDALYAGAVIDEMYQNWFKIPPLTIDGKPMKLVMRVHYGMNFENAYWDGMRMTFGDGGTMFYPLVSLGIGAHEISHGFTEQHSNLEYVNQSGGMNESFSDMAAQAAEFYSLGKGTWMIGADILKKGSSLKALRFMDKPSKDGYSIDSAAQYDEELDVHFSSGVYNRLFYLLANKPSWDIEKAFRVMVKANMDYWTPTSTFDQGGCGVLKATEELKYSVDDVKQVLGQVAIDYQLCV